MHADRANRTVLAVIGFVAFAVGVGGLLAAGGAFGHKFQHRRLVDNSFSRYVGQHGSWLWPTIAAVVLALTLLASVWLSRLLFSTDRTSDIAVAPSQASHGLGTERAAGRTLLQASALAKALADEIETYHGVTAARARVLGDPPSPTLAIDVTASRRADLAALVQRIEGEAISHARQTLERPGLPVKLDIAVTDKRITRTT